ncbi:MAG: outer membrane protein assembly factor BamE [Gammaproteobacteria bacterium]|nr:MAG: outer membrane protein assembly factor BamE [Gammaproteobacteria bacterium]
MKKSLILIWIGLTLSGCSLFRIHKMDIQQGNIIKQDEVKQLHTGMTQAQVKDIMGTPVLMNIFTPDRVDYVYTFKKGYGDMMEKQVTCHFVHGRLKEITSSY